MTQKSFNESSRSRKNIILVHTYFRTGELAQFKLLDFRLYSSATSVLPKVRLELATPGLQTQCSSHWAIQLKSYCWEGVEFIQLVYCIIIYLSFLNCDWLLIWEVQWFYWTQKLLVPVEKFTVRMPKVRYQEFLCPVEPLYFSDEKSITVEKW